MRWITTMASQHVVTMEETVLGLGGATHGDLVYDSLPGACGYERAGTVTVHASPSLIMNIKGGDDWLPVGDAMLDITRLVMANTEVEDNIYGFCKIVHPSGNLEEDKLIQSMIQ